jgi:hypothetical protein
VAACHARGADTIFRSPKRLEDLREAIEQKRREVPAFMKILREVYSGKDAG